MRRCVAFVGIVLALAGLRLFDNGVLSLGENGQLTVYGDRGAVYSVEDLPILYRENGYSRLDTIGDLESVYEALGRIDATVVRVENVDDIIVIYAYSPYINSFVRLSGDIINVMAAVSGENVAYGVPMLKGSY